jgi:hypothetical protein
LQCRGDDLQHALAICHYFMIIESKNSKAFRFKIKIATRVAPFLNRLEMLTTIQFHDQLRFVTEKIHDVGPNWRLTPKACAR